MNPIDPAELSALMDGELTPERAAEVREAVERDSLLRAELERLESLDAQWRSVASQAEFRPRVALPAGRLAWSIPLLLAGLILLRLLPKVFDLTFLGTVLHALALAAALAWIIQLVEHTPASAVSGMKRAVDEDRVVGI